MRTPYKPAHRKRRKWNAHSRRPRVEGPGLIWSWYLGEPGALLRAGVDQTTWRLVGVAAASLGDSRPSGAVGKHGWIRAEKTVGTYAGWSGNVPHAGKLFLRINSDVKHGPFSLTFSFLKLCDFLPAHLRSDVSACSDAKAQASRPKNPEPVPTCVLLCI